MKKSMLIGVGVAIVSTVASVGTRLLAKKLRPSEVLEEAIVEDIEE